MAGEFDSAWLKWDRGVGHAKTLWDQVEVSMKDFATRQPFTARTEYDARRHCVRLVLDAVEELPRELSLLVGDVANNFRSSLDHLAWALVTTRGTRSITKEEEKQIYFPLAKTLGAFNSHIVPSLLHPSDRRTIRRFQPFWHPARSKPHPVQFVDRHCLSVLKDLNPEDKHRTLRPVWAWPVGGTLFVGQAVDCTVTRIPSRARGIILGAGAELQRVYVKRTGPSPDVYLEVHLTVHPTLDARVTLESWLQQTTFHVGALLSRFSEPPKEVTL
jgi:hypothetical protein